MIGPQLSHSSREVEIATPPNYLYEILNEMKNENLSCVFGTWLVDGGPSVLLVDINCCRSRTCEIVDQLRNITSLPLEQTDAELVDSVLFGFMVFKLLDKV
jgi:hypothetical protein